MALLRTASLVGLIALSVFQTRCTSGTSSGGLDTSFGGSGIISISFAPGTGNDEAHAVVAQSDGKILLGGTSQGNFAIARVNTDGSLDTTFGTGGKVELDFLGGSDSLRGMALQTDGKILAVGSTLTSGGDTRFAVARLLPSGSLDLSFNGGAFTIAVGVGRDEASAVAVQNDGSVVVAGYSAVSGTPGAQRRFAVLRFTSVGVLDGTFGSGGKAIITVGTDDDASGLSILNDGRILVGGTTKRQGALGVASLHYEFAVARLTTAGILDPTFGAFSGGNGISTANFGQRPGLSPADKGISNDTASGLALGADGKIYLVGTTNDGTSDFLGIVRFRDNGDVDSTFATAGFYRATNFGAGNATGRAIAVGSDGSSMATGIFLGGINSAVTTRVDFSGAAVVGFGDQGKAFTNGGTETAAFAIATQFDGKRIIAGRTLNGTHYDFFAARFGP